MCALAALLNLTYHNPTAQAVVATMRVMPTILAFLDDAECVGEPGVRCSLVDRPCVNQCPQPVLIPHPPPLFP